jgi:predicted dehydrogenase
MASSILRFPSDRLATFTSSLGSAAVDSYALVGTQGDLQVSPGYGYHEDRKLTIKAAGKERKETFAVGDQFGAEILYFSRCVLENKTPEPGGRA